MIFPMRMSLLLGLSLFLASGGMTSTWPGATGVKITVRYTVAGIVSEQTIYFRADAKRIEYRKVSGHRYGPHMAGIERCDLGEAYDLNLDRQEYDSAPYPPKPLTKEQLAKSGMKPPQALPPGLPTLRIEVTTVDTGERKDFFGRTARHVITTTRETPLEGSHREAQETVIDGWYIDLDTRISCDRRWPDNKRGTGVAYLRAGNAPSERIESVQNGKAETGFPVETKMISKSLFTLPDGSEKKTDSRDMMKVIDFAEGPVNPALFEVPAAFKRMDHIDSNGLGEQQSALTLAWYRVVDKVEDLWN